MSPNIYLVATGNKDLTVSQFINIRHFQNLLIGANDKAVDHRHAYLLQCTGTITQNDF